MIVKAVKPLERETDGADQSRRAILRRDRGLPLSFEADAGEVVTFYFRTEKNGADAVVLLGI